MEESRKETSSVFQVVSFCMALILLMLCSFMCGFFICEKIDSGRTFHVAPKIRVIPDVKGKVPEKPEFITV